MSEKKGSPKIDGVVVLCVLIIILLVLVCVLPPVFRLIQSNESNPVPTQTPENKFSGTLMCQKEEDRQVDRGLPNRLFRQLRRLPLRWAPGGEHPRRA